MRTIQEINRRIEYNLLHCLGEYDALDAAEIAAWLSTGTCSLPTIDDVMALPRDTLIDWAKQRNKRITEARQSVYLDDGPDECLADELAAAYDDISGALRCARRRGDYSALRVVWAAEHGLRGAALERLQCNGNHGPSAPLHLMPLT